MTTRTTRAFVTLGLTSFGLASCAEFKKLSPQEIEHLDAYILDGRERYFLGDSPWGHDGKSLIACGEYKLFRVQIDGTEATQLTQEPAKDASYSPDGRWIAYTMPPSMFLKDFGKDHRLSWLSEDGLEHRSLEIVLDEISWSPDGAWITGSSRNIDPAKFVGSRATLVRADGGDSRDLGPGEEPVWSPNGTHIACTVLEGNHYWVEVMNGNGTERARLTSGMQPCWSRDGRNLALVDSDGEHGAVVFSMAISGGERRRLGEGCMPRWSPTDDRLLFTRMDQNRPDLEAHPLVTVRSDGSDERVLSQNGLAGHWSPDGSKVAFLRNISDHHELAVVNADGSGERSLGILESLETHGQSGASQTAPREL